MTTTLISRLRQQASDWSWPLGIDGTGNEDDIWRTAAEFLVEQANRADTSISVLTGQPPQV